MKNTILKYDMEELDEYIVSDYFSKNIYIEDIKSEMEGMLDVYKIEDNDKLERISYELYGTTDYWDILLMLNARDPLFDFPYDYDTVYDSARRYVDIYRFFIYAKAPLLSLAGEELQEIFLEQHNEQNENARFIFVVKPSRIGDFIKIANENGYV